MISALRRLDAWLIARVFQPVVDLSQRHPSWWARQAVVLFALVLIMDATLSARWSAFTVLSLAVPVPLALLLTFSPSALSSVAADWCRPRMALLCLYGFTWGLVLVLALFILALGATLPPFGFRQVAGLLTSVSWLSFVYFAACRPPAPPKRRAAARPAFGGAG